VRTRCFLGIRTEEEPMAKGFNLDNSPAHLLRRATQYANDIYANEVGEDALTARQFAVLLTVEANEGLSQTDLVNLTGIDRSTLADMIGRMLKKDLLRRRRTDDDARANSVTITGSGKRALSTVLSRVKKAEDKVLAPLPSGKRSDFLKMLTLIAEAGGPDVPEKPKGKKGKAKRGKRK
jgi:MarR family transcriptional regulator, lower aerobic nicotinate degradation pathway regulator